MLNVPDFILPFVFFTTARHAPEGARPDLRRLRRQPAARASLDSIVVFLIFVIVVIVVIGAIVVVVVGAKRWIFVGVLFKNEATTIKNPLWQLTRLRRRNASWQKNIAKTIGRVAKSGGRRGSGVPTIIIF